jgi:hypothetical protein
VWFVEGRELLIAVVRRRYASPMNESQTTAQQGSLQCIACTVAALLPLPVMYVLELTTRSLAFRSSGMFQFAMFLLLISIPIIFLVALVMFFRRLSRLSSHESGIQQRHVISAGVVAAFHGTYIVGFFLSPWPVAISGM